MIEPKLLIKYALKKGFNIIAITDHNTIKGGKIMYKLSKKYADNDVICGSEIKTNYGEIIGLFLEEEVLPGDFFDVISNIKEQNGLIMFPHPYRNHKKIDEIIKHVDLIESLNGRSNINENLCAKKLAKKYDKPMVSGSDSHSYFEFGKIKTIFNLSEEKISNHKHILINCERKIYGKNNSKLYNVLSYSTEILKKLFSR